MSLLSGLMIFCIVMIAFSTFISVLFGCLIMERTKNNSTILNRVDGLEIMLASMINNENEPNNNSLPEMGGLYRSIDGKHSAATLEELIQKMQNDPTSNLSPTDADGLRNLFENLLGGNEQDDEDEDDEQKPWLKGK